MMIGKRKPETNNEGLILREWLYAAGYSPELCTLRLYRAWRNGEDPTEYRKEKEDLDYKKYAKTS